jgi:DNA-binding MarR family transcriptional regulator
LPHPAHDAAGKPSQDPATDFQLSGFLPYSITVLAAEMSERFGALYQEQFGITMAEWRILAYVAANHEMSVREIAAGVVLDKAKVSRGIARLQAQGHVRKRAGKTDGRLVRISLTPKGRRLFTKIVPLANDFQAWLLDALDDKERRQLETAIAVLRRRLIAPSS